MKLPLISLPLQNRLLRYWSLCFVALTAPLLLYVVCTIAPTFDDWTYLTAPNFLPLHQTLGVVGEYWRPFDALVGTFLAFHQDWFPTLNHLLIVFGHLLGTFLVYLLARTLGFSRPGTHIATLSFYISPFVWGTVMNIDSINQVYASTLGLLAALCYLRFSGKRAIIGFLFCSFIATLFKENGITWFVVIPLTAWAFHRISLRQMVILLVYALLTIVLYFAIRLSLPNTPLFQSELYHSVGISTWLRNTAKMFYLLFLPTDSVAIVRNNGVSIITAVIVWIGMLPFMSLLWQKGWVLLRTRQLVTLLSCVILLSLPHLLTVFTVMHAYASASFMALSLGYMAQMIHPRQWLYRCFAIYLLACVITTADYGRAAYQSGRIGVEMTQSTLQCFTHPVDSVFSVSIDYNRAEYSSFIVPPHKAFAWGSPVIHANKYQWPKHWKDVVVPHDKPLTLAHYIQWAKAKGYKHILIYRDKQVEKVS